MRRQTRMIVIALGGAAASLAAVTHFVLSIFDNNLKWSPEIQVYYVAVGASYTQGFAIGFFLCFSLAVAATAVAEAHDSES